MDCIGLETSFDCSGIQIWWGLETWNLGLKIRVDWGLDWAIICHARDLAWAGLYWGCEDALVRIEIWLGWVGLAIWLGLEIWLYRL